MNSNQIMKADILDIVFENRNKAYGAYVLRKFYPDRLKLAMGFMFIIAIVFSGFTLIPDRVGYPGDTIVCPIAPETQFREVIIPPLEPKQKVTAEQPIVKEQAKSNQTIFNSNVLIVDNKIKTAVINTLLPTDVIGTENINNANPAVPALVPVQPQAGSAGKENNTPKIEINTPMDAAFVEVLPLFPGGVDALKKFLEKNLANPYDLENGETVNVKVRFVVGYDGKLKSFTVLQDGGDIYNKEVMRVLKKMPDWIPGKAKGQFVSVYYTIPVKFVMSN